MLSFSERARLNVYGFLRNRFLALSQIAEGILTFFFGYRWKWVSLNWHTIIWITNKRIEHDFVNYKNPVINNTIKKEKS